MDNDRVVATVLGYPGVRSVWEERANAPFRLAYLLDIPARSPHAVVVLRQVLDLFLEHAQVPGLGDVAGLNEQTSLLASNAVPVEREFVRAAAAGFVVDDAADPAGEIFAICSAALRYLFASVIVARGDVDARLGVSGFVPRGAGGGALRSTGDVAAAFLSFPDVGAIRVDPRVAAVRLSYVLGVPASTPESVLVLSRVLQLFVEETPRVPELSDMAAMVRETGRIAGTATPFDAEFRFAAAQGFDVADAPDVAEAVCLVCDRVARFLFKAVIVARGETDRFLEGVS
ncbi:hypothetical protein ABZ319_38420 [Nocardia sp. NPDC005978]|uniref:hypothetical protein n=1 Tax=Nocardia sp. NPDC005978 TaxID=3156725 RepID=UPI0033A33CB6